MRYTFVMNEVLQDADKIPTIDSRIARTAAVLFALTFGVSDAGAQTASEKLRTLSEVPSACSALAKGGKDVQACRSAFLARGEEIQRFMRSPEVNTLRLLGPGVATKERCAAALRIIDSEKGKLEGILKYFLAEASSGATTKCANVFRIH